MIETPKLSTKLKGASKKGHSRRKSIIEDRRERISDTFHVSTDQPSAAALTTALTQDELKRSFDEWMKIVADNVNFSRPY